MSCGHWAILSLWYYVVYQMSGVICKFFTFSFEYISSKKTTRKSMVFLIYFLLDKWLRILPKAYLISGMKYYCLYHRIITFIDPIISFILLLLWLLKFEFARARIRTFYIEIISFQCHQILVKTNNSNFE
jgi:hypothetical protein